MCHLFSILRIIYKKRDQLQELEDYLCLYYRVTRIVNKVNRAIQSKSRIKSSKPCPGWFTFK